MQKSCHLANGAITPIDSHHLRRLKFERNLFAMATTLMFYEQFLTGVKAVFIITILENSLEEKI
jgi:hypothetical protein